MKTTFEKLLDMKCGFSWNPHGFWVLTTPEVRRCYFADDFSGSDAGHRIANPITMIDKAYEDFLADETKHIAEEEAQRILDAAHQPAIDYANGHMPDMDDCDDHETAGPVFAVKGGA